MSNPQLNELVMEFPTTPHQVIKDCLKRATEQVSRSPGTSHVERVSESLRVAKCFIQNWENEKNAKPT